MSDEDRPGTAPNDALPPSPWDLVDHGTVDAVAAILERLTRWLSGPDRLAVASCAQALSCGETADPISISSWTDCLAARLRRCADADEQLQP